MTYAKRINITVSILLLMVLLYGCAWRCVIDPRALCFGASLIDTDPNVVYSIVYPGHYVYNDISSAQNHNVTKLINNATSKKGSIAEINRFLSQDGTYKIKYDKSHFVCADAATRVHNNAEAVGLRCGYVLIWHRNLFCHAINVFALEDGRFMFVEATPNKNGDGGFREAVFGNQEISNEEIGKFLGMDDIIFYHIYW